MKNGALVKLLLFAFIFVLATFLFLHSDFFLVGTVSIQGNHHLSKEEILQIAGIPERINIFRLNTTDIANKLLKDLRIYEVKILRKYPATVIINIRERQPLVYLANAYGFVQVDQHGLVLAAFKNIKYFNVPIVTGIRLGNAYTGDTVNLPQLVPVLTYLSLLNERTLAQISEMSFRSPEEYTAYTVHSMAIILGKAERMEEKARLTNEIVKDLENSKARAEYIDLSYISPYVKLKRN
ncbi:cell division protein FtsQ/DivIB [Acetonema longum]|uniref:Polypeptide-transport-associated domain protein FtsQ-type n=1 Tax=Acetonema longum DSM 6540 TaxID=1009370 RepID=F7NMZ5_9FIRM|nr:FtsQ-type POTRA domain-containing protein [Acetonema longum]EGO62573.1 polypeptide-transport-associated domain protein FtsQ-type [Acetonema longum DSM 6540]